MMELDARTGQVLDAIKQTGIEDNTIVIWISDNASAGISGPPQFRGGSNGPFRGELGDALDGSLRVPGMIRWPGHIKPGVSNEMVSIHVFFPTLAHIIGAPVPADRPIDGVDQSDFFLGKQAKSNRESLITFIGDEIAAVRWRQWRIYPKQFVSSAGNPSMGGAAGYRMEGTGFPSIFNVELDPREEYNVTAWNGWVINYYTAIIGAYLKSLDKYPNPPAISLTDFKTSRP
jgi:arylsulfatase A-like enzyme